MFMYLLVFIQVIPSQNTEARSTNFEMVFKASILSLIVAKSYLLEVIKKK